jgi:hypothetical protein
MTLSRLLFYLDAASGGKGKRVTEAGRETARSTTAAKVSPDPEAYEDEYGPRSSFLRRMDTRSQQTKVLTRGPTGEAKRAASIVDAANAARAIARQRRSQ